MRFSVVTTIIAILPLGFATPIDPVPAVGPVPGVNIINPAIPAAKANANSYVIVYKASASDDAVKKHVKDIKKALGKEPTAEFDIPGFRAVHIQTDTIGLGKVGKDPAIDYVEIDSFASVEPIVNASNIAPVKPIGSVLVQTPNSIWGLGRISHKLRGYFNYIYDTTKCQNTRVYVLDTGIRLTHEQFVGGRAVWGANFVPGAPNTDDNGHGTHCAGTIGGVNFGVCKLTTLVAVKVLNSQRTGAWTSVQAGLNWAYRDAVSRGMLKRSVVSMSLGGGYVQSINDQVNALVNAGLPIVVSAGNDNKNAASVSPASAANAITVGASDFYDYRATFSNFGASLDIFAPGVTILSSYFTSNTAYQYLDGTSMAAPHVSGLVAYFIAKDGLTSPAAIRNRLISLATTNKLYNIGSGSPNRLAYNGDGY